MVVQAQTYTWHFHNPQQPKRASFVVRAAVAWQRSVSFSFDGNNNNMASSVVAKEDTWHPLWATKLLRASPAQRY